MPRFYTQRTLIILLLLASCAREDNWRVSYIRTGDADFNSSKLTYLSHGIDLELMQTPIGFRSYLKVHSHPAAPHQGNPKKAFVSMQTEKDFLQDVAARHEGGQKIVLPPSLEEFLLTSLKEGKSVTIEISGYKITISPEAFEKRFHEMQNPPLHSPFHLPF